jgi:hypothetical protein
MIWQPPYELRFCVNVTVGADQRHKPGTSIQGCC